ncbi:hypothetical protein B0O99DRAFT_532585, partial [Bisporella sp. PMI_857]
SPTRSCSCLFPSSSLTFSSPPSHPHPILSIHPFYPPPPPSLLQNSPTITTTSTPPPSLGYSSPSFVPLFSHNSPINGPSCPFRTCVVTALLLFPSLRKLF